MSFPSVEHCVVCDALRLEEKGKISILGLLGFAPDAIVVVPDATKPVRLAFGLFGGFGDDLTYLLEFEILDKAGHPFVKSPQSIRYEAKANQRIALFFEVTTKYPGPGTYAVRLLIGGKKFYDGSFLLRQEGPAPSPASPTATVPKVAETGSL